MYYCRLLRMKIIQTEGNVLTLERVKTVWNAWQLAYYLATICQWVPGKIVHNTAIFVKWRDKCWPFDVLDVTEQDDDVIMSKVRPYPHFPFEMLAFICQHTATIAVADR